MSLSSHEKELVELWLLDLACERYIPARLAALSDWGMRMQWNRRPPVPWDQWIAIAALARLLQAGQIDVLQIDSDETQRVEGRLRDYLKSSPAPWLQEHLRRRKRDLIYLLTPEGAARWEDFFQPDWSRYWDEHPDYGEDGATVRNRYECGSYETRIRALSRCVECQGIALAFGLRDVELTEVAPWPATYWKTLPRGYVATVTYRDRFPEWDEPFRRCDACNEVSCWRRSIDPTT